MRFLPSLDWRSTKPPPPELLILLVQLPLQHIRNIFPDNRHELETVPGASGTNIKVLGIWVCTDAEIDVFGVAVPITLLVMFFHGRMCMIWLVNSPAHPSRYPFPIRQLGDHITDERPHFLFDLSRDAIFRIIGVGVTQRSPANM